MSCGQVGFSGSAGSAAATLSSRRHAPAALMRFGARTSDPGVRARALRPAHLLGDRGLIAIHDDYVGDGQALAAIGELLLSGDFGASRDIGPAFALPVNLGSHSAAD